MFEEEETEEGMQKVIRENRAKVRVRLVESDKLNFFFSLKQGSGRNDLHDEWADQEMLLQHSSLQRRKASL